MTLVGLRVRRRLHVTAVARAASILAALLAAFTVSSFLIATAGASIPEAFTAFLRGAFGSRAATLETLVQSTPLIFTGLAVVVAFRARVWNIGAEGQFFAGALAAVVVTLLAPGLPAPVLITAVMLASMAGGALWGLAPGVLKARYGTNEVVVTVMMNFIMAAILSFLLGGVLRDPSSFFLQTAVIPEDAFLPRLIHPSRLHLGFVLALIAAAGVFLMLWRTVLGYEIRAIGSNPRAAQQKGIEVGKTIVLVMLISAALAGLAGGSEVAGLHHRLRLDISTGYGFTGIIIGLLARLNPIVTVFAAILFGALINGSTSMQIVTGVPVALVFALQGLTLIFVLIADVLARYQVTRPAASV
ncbi:MAG: ABC transporter permease [Actinomycetota bacterium]